MAEKEYIDKVAFNYAIREAVKKYPNSFYNGLEVARQIAHDLPAADVREVKMGKWKVSVHKTYYDVSCSVCGINSFFRVDEKDSVSYANFCPNCGADMRGEQDV